ncbi:MAG: TspO/MBR family protein [archaeon]
MGKTNWKVLAASFSAVIIAAFIGSMFTDTGSWYESRKSALTPPDFVFPVVWTSLFVLIALSIYFSWVHAKKRQKNGIALLFGINLVLNMLWSVLFFGLKNPLAAFIELILLWFSILAMIFATWKIDRKAALLLVPYLLWVSFAGILNFLFI